MSDTAIVCQKLHGVDLAAARCQDVFSYIDVSIAGKFHYDSSLNYESYLTRIPTAFTVARMITTTTTTTTTVITTTSATTTTTTP